MMLVRLIRYAHLPQDEGKLTLSYGLSIAKWWVILKSPLDTFIVTFLTGVPNTATPGP